jgi:hypothetical protein
MSAEADVPIAKPAASESMENRRMWRRNEFIMEHFESQLRLALKIGVNQGLDFLYVQEGADWECLKARLA